LPGLETLDIHNFTLSGPEGFSVLMSWEKGVLSVEMSAMGVGGELLKHGNISLTLFSHPLEALSRHAMLTSMTRLHLPNPCAHCLSTICPCDLLLISFSFTCSIFTVVLLNHSHLTLH
jgi:hypothetical protein